MSREEKIIEVTRVEIAEHVASAFDHGPTDREELLEAARAGQARSEVLGLLEQLPAGKFRHLRQLWPKLPEIAVDAPPPELASTSTSAGGRTVGPLGDRF